METKFFTWEDVVIGEAAQIFYTCTAVRDIGPIKAGETFDSVAWVTHSGEFHFRHAGSSSEYTIVKMELVVVES